MLNVGCTLRGVRCNTIHMTYTTLRLTKHNETDSPADYEIFFSVIGIITRLEAFIQ